MKYQIDKLYVVKHGKKYLMGVSPYGHWSDVPVFLTKTAMLTAMTNAAKNIAERSSNLRNSYQDRLSDSIASLAAIFGWEVQEVELKPTEKSPAIDFYLEHSARFKKSKSQNRRKKK